MSERIRLMAVSGSLGGGGAERQMAYLLQALDSRRFSLTLCLFRKQGAYLKGIPSYVRIHDLGARERFNAPKLILGLRHAIQSEEPAVLLSMLWRSNVYALLASRLVREDQRPRTIVGVRNNPVRYSSVQMSCMRWLYPRADLVIANSHGLADAVGRTMNIPAGRLTVVPNGVDFETVRARAQEPVEEHVLGDGEPLLVSVASLTRKKGHPDLFKAVQLVNRQIRCQLLVVGSGPDEPMLRKLASDLGIEKRVHFLGHQRNPYPYMARADVFVLASLWEGMPNVVLEAMSLGTPVVATRAPYGSDEIVEHGVNGILVPVRDPERLAEGIRTALADEGLQAQFRNEGRRTVEERFGLQVMVREYERTIVGLAGKTP